ncbi:MAG: 1-acyl-sn-glycerol-3-phosphate acyltransferase [Candidatus Omnitrophica bacterium]|nr:1-acyl-sn-glycerol-3-phosphate acyltransferase [Candidatus Omnitrophota bacterium]
MIYWIIYFSTKLLSLLFFPLKIQGRENVPKEGAFLLACNHVSYLDPMIMGIATGRRLNYMAKDELFHRPVLGYILRSLWAFPVKRNRADKKALRESLDCLKKGRPLLLFPEGTRHGTPGEKKIEAGVGFLALKADVPVVPVFVDGSQKVFPPGAKTLRRGQVLVRYGKPIRFVSKGDYEQVAQEVMDSIFALR